MPEDVQKKSGPLLRPYLLVVLSFGNVLRLPLIPFRAASNKNSRKSAASSPATEFISVEQICDADNRIAMAAAVRQVMMTTPDKFDPRDFLKPAREAMKKVCIARMVAFGQAGNASKMRSAGLVK